MSPNAPAKSTVPFGESPLRSPAIDAQTLLDPLLQSGASTGAASTGSIHLIGVAGAGMQALAEVLLGRGYRLSGSDLELARLSDAARRRIHALQGHHADHLPRDCDGVIYSAAIGEENPERVEAARRGIAQMSYPQAVARMARGSHCVAVAGTHGKSTTTLMLAAILTAAGRDPTVIAGATTIPAVPILPIASEISESIHPAISLTSASVSPVAVVTSIGSGGRAGMGPDVVVEACEFRRHFLELRPQLALLLGIEGDHFDCFPTPQSLHGAFADFVAGVDPRGLLLSSADCPHSARIAQASPSRHVTFGLAEDAHWRADQLSHHRGRYHFCLRRGGHRLGTIRVPMPGRHNAMNALAAAAAAGEMGLPFQAIEAGLRSFPGVRRRVEFSGRLGEIPWIDDFAHHPTAVAAAIRTVRQMYPRRRLVCLFQPHQLSRTRHLLDGFAKSLQNADAVAIADVYCARETVSPAAGTLSARLAEAVCQSGQSAAVALPAERIVDKMTTMLTPRDVLLSLSAGDIGKVMDELAGRLRRHRAA
jgi:UDP-N-acetylmuramate--alanine ligase